MAWPTRMGGETPKKLAAEGSMARWAWVSLWIFAGIFILGVKWWLIDMLGVNVPFLDQWDAEGRNLYAAWQTGELTFSSLIAAHNEHRIITGRLWHLLWFLLNEQTWNVRLQMQVNAIVHTTAVLLVTAAACAHGGRRLSVASLPILLVGLAVGAVPSAWFNLFGGFQVQFYFALLFQIVAMLLWLANAPLSMKWWLGTAAYLVAMNSVATGSLVGFAVVPVLLVHRYRQMPSRKDWLAVATILGMGVIASVFTVSVSVVSLRAGAPSEFLSTLLKSLSYPFMNIRWPAFLLWFPFGVHVALWFRRGRETSAWDDRLVCLGLWVMAMAAATSYGRGADGRGPLVHYMDHLAPGLLVNMGCLVRVGLLWHRRGIGIKMAHGIGFSLWAYVVLVGYSQAAGNSNGWVRGPKFRHFQTNTMARNLHHYLVTGDVSHLTDHGAVPYFTNPKHQQKLADRAEIREILPPDLTKTLKFKVLGMGGKAKLPVITH